MPSVSIRDDIITAIHDAVDAMTDASGDRLWNQVVYGTYDDIGALELPVACIDPGPDKPSHQTMFKTDKRMIVTVGFQFLRDKAATVDNYKQFEIYYAALVSALTADLTIGGAIVIREAGAGSEIEGRGDPRPGGYCLFEVDYRHARTNPAGKP